MYIKSIILVTIFILVSCGGYNTGVTQKENKGFIKFTGNTNGVSVEINSESKFDLNPEIERYELKPGQYNLKVYRNDDLIVNRTIIIDSQTTYEIEVP
jgi:outer membrane usher protein FimD/PapC